MPKIIRIVNTLASMTEFLGTFITAIVVIVVSGIILDVIRKKRKRKNEALQKFKSAFTDLIFELDDITEKTERYIPIIILQRHINKIKKATIDFGHTLTTKKRFALERAWIGLSCEDNEKQTPSEPSYYKYLSGNSIEIRNRIKTEINNLFEIN